MMFKETLAALALLSFVIPAKAQLIPDDPILLPVSNGVQVSRHMNWLGLNANTFCSAQVFFTTDLNVGILRDKVNNAYYLTAQDKAAVGEFPEVNIVVTSAMGQRIAEGVVNRDDGFVIPISRNGLAVLANTPWARFTSERESRRYSMNGSARAIEWLRNCHRMRARGVPEPIINQRSLK